MIHKCLKFQSVYFMTKIVKLANVFELIQKKKRNLDDSDSAVYFSRKSWYITGKLHQDSEIYF